MTTPEQESEDLPKSTPRWLRNYIKRLEYDLETAKKKHERLLNYLRKTQEDFQDLLDLIERIADDRQPLTRAACRAMVERFNPGSYEDNPS